MEMKRHARSGTLVVFGLLLAASLADAQSLAGMWDATVDVNGLSIPFRFELTGTGRTVAGSFFNGDEKVTSTSGSFADGALTLNFDDYGTKLQAAFKDGQLDGRYERGARGFYPFRAKRFSPPPETTANVPSIAGLWSIPTSSSKGEAAWRLIVRQSGPEVSAAILRVDGDTGALTGRYKDGTFVLSHFSGARPLLLEATVAKDGTLDLLQNRKTKMMAVRADEAKARGLPEPADPSRFTSMKDPTEPLRFSFPDLEGRVVSNTDARFRGKVLIISITGSWCPNCHDEAPFLAGLYRTYHQKGLEIVAFAFEEADQLKNPMRLRAFIKQYHIDYTVLLAGEPGQLNEKVPQAVNLNSYPTSFFVGRDGLVKGAHAGFAGRASGSFHAQTKQKIIAEVEHLLGERTQPTR